MLSCAFCACGQTLNTSLLRVGTIYTGTPPPSLPLTADFASSLSPLAGTGWGILGGNATNSTTWSTNYVTDPNFTDPTYWNAASGNSISGNAVHFATTSASYCGINQTTDNRFFYGFKLGDFYKWSYTISDATYLAGSGSIYPTLDYAAPNDLNTAPANILPQSVGTYSGTFARGDLNGLLNISTPAAASTGAVSMVSFRMVKFNEMCALASVGQTNVSVSCKIASMPSNSAAGLVLRLKPVWNCIAIGDSKSDYNYNWKYLIADPVLCADTYNGYPGDTINSLVRDFITNGDYLFNLDRKFDAALIDVGVNDYPSSGLNTNNTFNNLNYLVNFVAAQWPGIQCYIANVWGVVSDVDLTVRDCTNVNKVIDMVVAANSSFCHAGHDERIWLEGGDNGATYGPLHYSSRGMTNVAIRWHNILGSCTKTSSGNANAIYVYFNNFDNTIKIVANAHGSNRLVSATSATYDPAKLLCASVNANKIKVFYGGNQVGSVNASITEPELGTGTQVGLFATDPATSFSFFAASNSTSSDTAP